MRTLPAELVLYDKYRSVTIRPNKPSASDEVICTSWDLGAPDVRITSTPRVGADGTDDGAGYLGSRTVTLDLVFLGQDPYGHIDLISAMAHPNARPSLRVTRIPGQPWTLPLRGVPFGITYGREAAGKIEAQVTFQCPQGFLQGPLRGPYSARAATNTESTDWRFPAHFNKGFGMGVSPYATVNLNIGGSLTVAPIIYIFGPATNPKLFTDTGQRFEFDNLVLRSGQAVQIDMGRGTVYSADRSLVANDSYSLWSKVNFERSTFWQWQPGPHVVYYATQGGSMAVQYQERRLNI